MFEEEVEVETNEYKRWSLLSDTKFEDDSEARHYISIVQKDELNNTVEDAMDVIIKKNLPMISMYARKYSKCGSSFEDLQSEGILAVIKAVNSFKLNSTVSVGTAMITAVKTAMRRYVGTDRNVRISVIAHENKRKIHAIIERLKTEGKPITIPILVKESNLKTSMVKKLIKIDVGVVSMNIKSEGDESEGDEIGDLLVSENYNPSDEADKNDKMQFIKNAVKNLDDIERFVIENRYLNKDIKTLNEIGQILGKKEESVRLIEKQAIERIKYILT